MVRANHILMGAVLALLGLGVVMVQSAGTSMATMEPGGPWQQALELAFSRSVIYAVLAVGAMLLASRLDVRSIFRGRGLKNPVWLGLAIALGCLAATLVPGWGKTVNGATRWLQIDTAVLELTFQPSELVKWTLVVFVAWWCARMRGVMDRFWLGLVPPLALIALACGLVVVEDLGTAVLIAAVAGALLLAGGARLWHLLMLVPPAGAAVAAAILHSPYRMERLTIFLHPWQDPQGAGYHPIQSMIAFAEGGLTGSGLGHSIQKYYIPEDTTDFLFPIIAEELGLAGAGLVVFLLLVILWVGLGIVKDSRDTFGRLLGLGVLLMVGAQATMNIAVTTVLVPTKGIALPLVSAGGTGWAVTAFALGLLAALDNANHLEAAETAEPAAAPTVAEGPTAVEGGETDQPGTEPSKPAPTDRPRLRLAS